MFYDVLSLWIICLLYSSDLSTLYSNVNALTVFGVVRIMVEPSMWPDLPSLDRTLRLISRIFYLLHLLMLFLNLGARSLLTWLGLGPLFSSVAKALVVLF